MVFVVFFQCKVTVPKMGSIQDLCTAVATLLKVAPDKVVYCRMFGTCRVILLSTLNTTFTQYNRLYSRLDVCLHDTARCQTGCTTGCGQTGCTTGLTTVLNEQPVFVQPVVKPGCTAGCIVYANIQPVVKPTSLTRGCIV